MMDSSCWTTLAAFLLILLFAGAADGIMGALGPVGFLCVGVALMSAAGVLVEGGAAAKVEDEEAAKDLKPDRKFWR